MIAQLNPGQAPPPAASVAAGVIPALLELARAGYFTGASGRSLMAEYFAEPYPARAAVGVAALPKGAQVEMDAVMVLGS